MFDGANKYIFLAVGLVMAQMQNSWARPLIRIPMPSQSDVAHYVQDHAISAHKKHKKNRCCSSKFINKVPVVIDEPGKYCVPRKLVYDGNDKAIIVTADNVTINFFNHDLILNDTSAIGIYANGVSELTILNDKIQCATQANNPRSIAIQLINTSKVTIDNVFTANTNFGISATDVHDVKVANSHFEHHNGLGVTPGTVGSAPLNLGGCENFEIESCIFEENNSSNAFFAGVFLFASNAFQTPCRNFRISNCQFLDTFLFIEQVDGILMENCTVTVTDPTFGVSFAQIGLAVPGSTFAVNDMLTRNCTFTNLNANPGFDGINVYVANGVLMENTIIDMNAVGVLGYNTAGLRIGGSTTLGSPSVVNDLIFRNSIIRNSPNQGIFFDTGNSKIVSDNCLISGAVTANIFNNGTINSTIKNCQITQGVADGIVFAAGSNNNALLTNVVTGNAGSGIVINSGALNNHLEGNKVFANTGDGINNGEASTETYFNSSCNNGGVNCIGVTPAQAIGVPPLTGSNICCSKI